MQADEKIGTKPAAQGRWTLMRRIDVGGRRLSIATSGERSPTVVLETGLGAESNEWAPVQRGLEDFVRVFRYDRAGRGASDRAPHPRTARHMVEELHILLRRSGTPGPYILVGHSYGGLLARLFTHLYRDEVAGLVLVDSMHEDQFDLFGPAFPLATESDPPALREFREFWTRGWRRTDSTTEGIDLPASIAQGRTVQPFGDLPMRVLTAGAYLNQPLAPPAMRPVLQGMWNQLQAQFLELSKLAEPIYAESSGHFVQRDDPDAVIDAVCQVVAEVRAGARL